MNKFILLLAIFSVFFFTQTIDANAKSLTIIQPSSTSTSYSRGDTINIVWRSSDIKKVNIDLMRENISNPIDNIARSINATSTQKNATSTKYNYSISKRIKIEDGIKQSRVGNNYYIRIKESKGNFVATSTKFSIVGNTLSFTNESDWSNKTLSNGATTTIKWVSDGFVPTTNLYYGNLGEGNKLTLIRENVPGKKNDVGIKEYEQKWKVPAGLEGSGYLFFVEKSTNPGNRATSSTFSVRATSTPDISHQGGKRIYDVKLGKNEVVSGDNLKVTWKTEGLKGWLFRGNITDGQGNNYDNVFEDVSIDKKGEGSAIVKISKVLQAGNYCIKVANIARQGNLVKVSASKCGLMVTAKTSSTASGTGDEDTSGGDSDTESKYVNILTNSEGNITKGTAQVHAFKWKTNIKRNDGNVNFILSNGENRIVVKQGVANDGSGKINSSDVAKVPVGKYTLTVKIKAADDKWYSDEADGDINIISAR